jgi:hypothetical protein
VGLRRPLLHALLLMLGAAVWAMAINSVCPVVEVLLLTEADFDIRSGWYHELLRMGLFGLALVMILCTDRLLIFMLLPTPDKQAEAYEEELQQAEIDAEQQEATANTGRGRAGKRSPTRLAIVAALFAALGVIQILTFAGAGTLMRAVVEKKERLTTAFDKTTLPESQNGWQQISFQHEERDVTSELGQHSMVWRYQRPLAEATVCCDFHFVGWHPLADSYQAQGWETLSRDVVILSEQEAPFVRVGMEQADGTRATLLYSLFDDAGRPLEPPGMAIFTASSWYRAVNDRISRRLTDFGLELSTYQVQLLVVGEVDGTDEEEANLEEMFLQSRELIRERIQGD